jgi:hypothetical protein
MKHLFRWASFALVLALALPVFAADEKKDAKKDADKKDAKKKDDKKDAKKEKDDDKKADKLEYSTAFVGKLTQMSGNSQKDFTVQIEIKYLQPNVQAQNNLLRQQAEIARLQAQIRLTPNPYQRQQLTVQLLQKVQQLNQQKLYDVKTVQKNIELRAADEVKVRTLQPPVDYDDKGNLKKYTQKELNELRGPNKNLPGYTGEFESLRQGQIVKIYLSKKDANFAKNVKKKGGKKKKQDEEDADEDLDVSKPEAVMIVVMREAPPEKG